jgi:hypothetical protein
MCFIIFITSFEDRPGFTGFLKGVPGAATAVEIKVAAAVT